MSVGVDTSGNCDDWLTTPSSKSLGITRRVLKTMDHDEEGLNTEGQYYDQDLKHYEQEVEQINGDELHSD